MKTRKTARVLFVFFLISGLLLLLPSPTLGHCDGMDGPVVKTAQKALETNNVNLVLIWVQERDEAEIRRVFDHALAVRKLGPQARELADRFFFETLVRIHRAGEGEEYTGLKPAGRDLGPVIPAADKGLEENSVEPLVKLLTDSVQAGVSEHFRHAQAKKNFSMNDVAAGREYVMAYVEFIHYAEQIYDATKPPAEGHNKASGSAVVRKPATQ